jgi:serine/threonine protein kinase
MSVLNPNLPQRYRVLSRLGEGNMGEVWRVEDSLNPEAPRALKRIKVDLSAEKALILRFRAEFHAMARLHHPNIVEMVSTFS